MNTYYKPYLIAITGGIASGKTSFCNLLEKNNYTVYYADKIAHKAIDTAESQMLIKQLLGEDLIQNGKVNRKKTAELVFNNTAALKILNSIIHPAVRKEMQNLINNFKKEYLFFEVPLLFENDLYKSFEFNVLISADKKTRIERAVKNRGYSIQEATARVNSQMPEDKKAKLADYIIYNNNEINALQASYKLFIDELNNLKHKNVKKLI